jgi:hypothetical protein
VKQRTDIHRTGAVIPADYDFVSFGYENDFFGNMAPAFLVHQRQLLKAHMMTTGGEFSQHEHGGTCHICGANAIYMVNFYHRATNTYIKTGHDCAAKMQMSYGDFNAFQAAVHDARQAHSGKAKARQILVDRGMQMAWAMYAGEVELPSPLPYEERTIIDIVSKLVRYGNSSDRAMNYAESLLKKIPARHVQQAQWAQEQAASKPAPTGDRVTFQGTVIKLAWHDSQFGRSLKMTVKHADGWAAWGTVPSGLEVEKGDVVRLTANLTASRDNATFAFFKRPTQATKLVDAPCVITTESYRPQSPATLVDGRFFRGAR